jgi:hypothetical protein
MGLGWVGKDIHKGMDKGSKVEFRPYIDYDGSTFDPPMSLQFACSVSEDSGQYLSTNFLT